jgi:hypothetical protein
MGIERIIFIFCLLDSWAAYFLFSLLILNDSFQVSSQRIKIRGCSSIRKASCLLCGIDRGNRIYINNDRATLCCPQVFLVISVFRLDILKFARDQAI